MIQIGNRKSVLFTSFIFLIFISISNWTIPKTSNVAPSLEIIKTADNTTYLTGDTITYTLQYRCASLTENCTGMMITDPLPASIEFARVIGSIHTINESYDPVNHTVTFTFEDPLIPGTVGEVRIQAIFPNGSTPNGTIASNTATISATNAVSASSTVDVSAIATSNPLPIKEFVNGGAAGGFITYQMRFCNDDYLSNNNGRLNLTDIIICDTLPAGATLVQLNPTANSIMSYDSISHTVKATISLLEPGECTFPKFSLHLSDPPFGIDTLISNTAYFSFTPLGEPRDTISSTVDYILTTEILSGSINKIANKTDYLQFENGTYSINVRNTGTAGFNDFCLIDSIPEGLEITSFGNGAWFYGGILEHEHRVDIYYTTNLNGPTLVPGSPFSIYDEGFIHDVENDLGLTIGGTEYITELQFCLGDIPAGMSTYQDILINFEVMDGAEEGIRTNCIEVSTSTDSIDWINSCANINILPNANGAVLNPFKGLKLGETNLFTNGDTVTISMRAANGGSAGMDLVNPVVYDLLPPQLTYVPGSWQITNGAWNNQMGAPDPIFTETPNHNNTGRTLLTWSWNGASSFSFPPNGLYFFNFKVIINNNAIGGTPSFENIQYIEGGNSTGCTGTQIIDLYDVNGNGNTTETLCSFVFPINIDGISSLTSQKLVKGQLDTAFTKYPDVGESIPGGIADYQLIIKNEGNVIMDSIIVIDILPHVGDAGVIDLSQRESRWQPNLVGPVIAPPGIIVFYSMEENPCRDIEKIVPSGPVGCAAPNWTSIPPSDITQVKSLKFESGSTQLNPNDSLILEWPMRVPVNVLSGLGTPPDTIAWNSFGFIGKQANSNETTLAAEPVKVGIALQNIIPGVFGDFIWLDANQDGIQDVGESSFDGLRVELFLDNGDGIADMSTDSLINFNLSANGGFYLFPNLPTGDYYATFYLPPTYVSTLPNIGTDDTIDSDGIPSTYNGFSVATTEITTITDTEIDFTWDFGIYQNGNGAIGNYIWNDVNEDGIQNESSADGMNGIVVNLYDNANPNTIFSTTITANDVNGNPGYYLFDQIPPGDYFIEVISPVWASFTSQGNTGTSDPIDSDVDSTTGISEVFTLIANTHNDNWDAGLILSDFDFGDGPAIYPDAWHHSLIDADNDNILDGANSVWLGNKTNFETAQLNSSTANLDAFDDGISFGNAPGQFPLSAVTGNSYDVDILLSSANPNPTVVYYGIWIDWDNNGTYEDFYSGSDFVSGNNITTTTINTPVIPNLAASVNVRLRVDDTPLIITDFQGGKSNGEIEDYQTLVALPIELSNFEGKENDCEVDLKWTTLTETNFSHFEIERSFTGNDDFEIIDIIRSHGLQDINNYIYKDQSAKAINYYRLKIVDLDETFTYSDQIFVNTNCEIQIKKLNIYPNPIGLSKKMLNLAFISSSESEATVTIHDIKGREMMTFPIIAFEGENNLGIDIQEIEAGTYILSLDNGFSRIKTKQFVKITE